MAGKLENTAIKSTDILYTDTVPGGWNWSHILKRGTTLRLTDLEGGACVSLLGYNPIEKSERYNMPDTLKCQFTARLTTGHALYSDMGRILLTIIGDSFGGHDPFGMTLPQSALEERFGVKRYQENRNAYQRSGTRALLTELAKYGLDDRDLVPPVNFFACVSVEEGGVFHFDPTVAKKGASVELQAEMDTLVVLAATQHPLDPRVVWEPKPVKIDIVKTGLSPENNPAYSYNDQNKRGFVNTALYVL